MQPPEFVSELQRAMLGGEEHLFEQLPFMIANVIRGRLWEKATDRHGETFRSFEAFVEHQLWQGLESSVDDLLAFCRKSPDTQALIREAVSAGPANGEVGNGRSSDNVRPTQHGNAATYTLRRLKRDAPALAEKVVRGELSANAAAIEAGFRAKQVQLAKDPQQAAKTIIAARGPEYAAALAGYLGELAIDAGQRVTIRSPATQA
jgi:hypothetical protein